tara:strand:+ start:473 stop:865 length:393 start_codon:yes stop_codon:yes gene_type:complete
MIIPNYKIGSDNNKQNLILQTGEQIKYLYRPTAIANYSFHDESDGTDYQIPVGKKFTALTYYKAHTSYAGQGFYSSPTVNSVVGATLLGYTGLPQNLYSIVHNMVWTAGNYVTTDSGAAGDRLIGVESNV